MTESRAYKPRHAASWPDDAYDYPTPFVRPRRKRRRASRTVLCITLALILTVGAGFALIWLPNHRAEVAERLRQAEWALEEARHPFVYRDMVEAGAESQGLDPALVAAVILNESSFDPKAESRLGARGLMQLMPGTAEWVAGKLKEPFSLDALYDPETNIRFGCWFMGYLTRKFDGDPVKVAAGYHAGGGQVEAWLNNPDYTQDGELTVIPFGDTDRYVRKVMNAYEVYQRHYYPEPETPDADA
ncbi:MAG: lytic transglycosylase domain-containing protein [Oscillospiraceae bacterium]|nr:lytic transglycosylase domain-containing protein [Oscillospiraceae bacterium]